MAMAKVPHSGTRDALLTTEAPPILAAKTPSSARKNMAVTTVHESKDGLGASITTPSGRTAPTAKLE